MRIRLLVDIETDDLEMLQRHVADQPPVEVIFLFDDGGKDHTVYGRFVGAKEAFDPVQEVAVAPDPKS